MPAWLQRDWCSSFVLALGHFIWQGTLVAVVLAIALRATKSVTARYWLSFAALLLMAACPAVSLGLLMQSSKVDAQLAPPPLVREVPSPSPFIVQPGVTDANKLETNLPIAKLANHEPGTIQDPTSPILNSEAPRPVPSPADNRSWWQKFAPQLTTAYLCGVALMLMRLVAGLWGGRRLRRRVHLIDDPSLLNAMQRQATALGLKLLPLLAYCERVTVPTVVGVLKPMILLPIALTSGLSPDQIESVLAHELAHLRRYDHLVNLMQRVIESLLFFHPAMWWVSHRVREEREHCCDDLVIACGAMPLDYAKSLLRVAELSRTSKLRRSLSAVSLLATGDKPSSLRQRISRLLGESATPSLRVSPRALLLAIGIPLVALIVTIQSGAGRDQVARPEPSKSVADDSPVADDTQALRKASERATQSESPAIDPTAGLPNSDEGTNPTNKANRDLRSNPAVGSGDARRVQQEPSKPKAGEKLDAGAERRLKWGEPVNGLRAAMCIQSVTDAAGDHKPDLFMAIQNVSEAPIHLVASAEFPNPRNGVLSGRGLPQARQMIDETMPIDVLLQPRQVTFMLWIEHATPDANRRDGRSLAQVLIVNTVETLSGTMAIDKAPPGAWTGKLVTGDTSGADAMVSLQPKGKEAQSLFKKWQNGSRANGDIPGGALGPLVRVMTNFVKNNPTHEGAPKFAELLKRIDTARDWPPAAAVTLLDEVSAIYPSLPEWVEGENRFKLGGDVVAGKPLPEELTNAPWGEADPNGLRVAWLLEPRALKYRLNTPLKSRLLFHNAGKNAVVFRALTWNQSGEHKARDAQGAEINIVSVEWTTIPMTFACRLAPGEFLEVTAAGIGVGANKDDEDWRDARSQVRVGAWIEAKAGDEVTFLPDAVHCDARDAGQPEGEEVATPENWWLKFIANRLSLDAPLPADAAERKRLLDRATRDLFGNAPTPEEITAFTTDSAPDALDALAKRLANRPGFETFSGSLKSGPRKFLVLPPDPDAAKKPRTAIGPGQYPLGDNVTFVVTRRPIGERIVNEAHLAFAPTDATKPAPREPHTIKLPDDYDSWLAAWMRGGTVLWVAQKGTDKKDSIRRYDFTNTESVKETEITELKPSDGLPQAILDALVPESDRTQSNADNEKTGLEFLKPYPKLHGLSLKMTEAQFLEIVKQQELKTRKTGEGDQTAYRFGLGDGLSLIVMFREDGTCRGIQRVRGENDIAARQADKPEKYSAKLPSGVEIELAGVAFVNVSFADGTKRRKDDAWWRADGTKLEAPPFKPYRFWVHEDHANFREFAIRLTPPRKDSPIAVTQIAASPSPLPTSNYGGGGWDLDDPGLSFMKFAYTAGFKDEKPVAIHAFVSDQPFGPAWKIDLDGKTMPSKDIDATTETLSRLINIRRVERNALGPKVDYQTVVRLELPPDHTQKMDFQIVAVSKQGESLLPNGHLSGAGGDGVTFKSLADDLSHFEIKLRPTTHKVTFENVSLLPGRASDVTVKVETIDLLALNVPEFLLPYPKLKGLSLDMTEPQFLEIVKQQELKTRKTGEGDQTAYRIGLGDGLYLIVMFREDGTCRGIQRERGEDEPLRDDLEESKTLNGLRTRITLLTQKPAVGSPLMVRIELQNVGEVERTYPWQGANPDYLLEVIGPDGKPSEFINGGQGIQVRPTKIKPGETVVVWDNLDVASMFLLPKAGRYEMKLSGPDQFKLDAANPNQTHPFPTSNTVAVTLADGTLNDIQATFVRIRTIAPKSWQISTSDNSIFDLQKTTTPRAEFILRFTESLLAEDQKMWRTMPSEYLGPTRLGHAYLAINPLAKTEWPDCVEQIRQSLPTADGLEFLKSYPKLQALSLKMTEPQFLEIVKQQGVKTRRSVEGNKSDGEKVTHHINLGDGHSLIVMFDKEGKCSGIQRVRGDNTPKEESTGPKSDAEPAQSQAAERLDMELLQKLVRGGKIDTKTINASITLVAARAAQDAAFARLVLTEFEKSCEGGVRTLQSRRHLLAVLTDIFEAWSSERWRSQLNRINPDVLPQVVPPRVDAKLEGEMLDRVIQHGYATDRSEIANASLAVRHLHHPAGRAFLRDVLRDPGSDTKPFAPTNPPKTVSQQQPNTTPSPKNNSEAPKTSRWKDNVGGGWTDAKFVAAVGLAELGESEGVEWLLARAQPNDFGIDSSLWTFPHSRDSRGSLMESCRLSLAELFGLPAQATTAELANWWRSNRTKFTARPATLKPHAGRGAPSPALAPTTGLRNSDAETNKTNNANGVQRPKPAAEPEDQRRAQAEPRALHKPSVLFPDHWIVQAVGFDGASYELVTASHQSFITIRRWDLVSMKLLSEIKLQGDKHGRAVHSETLKFSGDRKRVIAATDTYVGIWDSVTGKLLKQLPFETKNGIYECVIDNLDATPDLSLIVGHRALPGRLTLSYDAHVIVWDGETGKILRTLIDKGATDLKALDLSTDGKRLVTTNGSGAKIWDTSTGKLLRSIPNDNKGRKHLEADVATDSLSHVWSVQFSPDGQQLAIGDILGVKLIDTESGKMLRHLEGPYRYSSNSSPGLVFSKDGERLARLGTQEQVTIEMKDFPPDYRPEKDSKTKHRYVVPIWSTRTGTREFELHTEANDAAFTEDGQCLAVVFPDMQQALSVWQLNGDDTDDIKTAGPGPHSRVDRVEENGHYVGKMAAEYIEQFKPTWGEAKFGLQYGIALTKPTAQFKPSERVPLVAFFRNASDKPIKFNTAPDYYGNMPKILNAKGELIALENIPLLGHVPHYHETLAPGEALGPFYMSFGLGENLRPNQQHWHPLLKSPAAGEYKLTHTVTVNFPETIKDAPNAKAELTSSTVAFEIVDGQQTSKTSASRPNGQTNEFAATILGEQISIAQITPAEADQKRQELSHADYQKWLVEYRATALLQTIVSRVLKDYEVREKISPSDQELETLHRDFMEKYLAKYPQLDDEAKKKIGLQVFWSLGTAKDWRTAKALHSKYGGRVATSAFGAYTSIEGRNAVVKEYHTRGELKFHHAELEQRFWEKLKNDRVLDVIIPADRVKERFATPPWEARFNQLLEQAPDAADKNSQKPDGQPAKEEAVAKAPSEVSLSDVVRDFNTENKQLGRGLDQPAMTEDEVITSIKRDEWKRGDPWSLNDKEITAFKAVAESKRLPKGSYLAVHTEDRADTFLYKQLWQVQLMIPAIGHDGFVGLTIRNTLIAEEKIDPKDVAWGKPDDEGLSLGAYFSPRKAQYALGERVRLRLFVRNDGKQAVKTTWANTSHPMPDDFTVTDNTGAKVAVRIGHESWSLPWLSGYMSGGLAAGETHAYFIPYEVSLGDSDGNAAKNKLIGRIIETNPGQKLQLKVRAHNGNGRTRKESEVEPESGSVKFAMVEVDATAAARDESAVVGESLGKPVTAADVAQRGLHEAFVIPVLAKYREARREVLTPTKDEIQFALAVFNKKREANQKPLDEFFAKFMLDNWKLQKHLYDNFGGGRILWQQAGVEAFDAMRTWMEAQEKKGEFKVTSPELRKKLFHYWTTQTHGSFLTEDIDRIAHEFLSPEWVKPPAAPPVAPLSLKGRVMLEGPRLFAPSIQITSRDNTGETEVPDESLLISASGGVANVAIYLMESPKGWAATEPPREPVSIRVEDNLFRPRLSFARVGQPLRVFGRSTAIEHCNFHSFPLKSSPFNVVVPWSEHRDLPAFTHAEKIPVKIQSDIQPWRTAYMLALDHPFAAITDAEGRFEMRGLPPGEHHFRVWHEQAGYLNKDLLVKVETDKVVEVELKFEREKFRLIETLLKEPPQRRTPPTSTERRDARLKIHDRVAAKELVGNWKLHLPTGAAKFVKIAQLEEGQLHFTSQTQFLSTYAYCDGELGSVGSDNGDFLFKLQEDRSFVLTEAPHAAALIGAKLVRTNEPVEDTDVLPVPPTLTASQLKALREERLKLNDREAAKQLVGHWKVALPAGFVRHTVITQRDDGCLVLSRTRAHSFAGVYAFVKGELLLIEPIENNVDELRFKLGDDGRFKLIRSEISSGNYTNTTLSRETEADSERLSGTVMSINREQQTAIISVGTGDHVKQGMRFAVRFNSTDPKSPAVLHGTVEVTRITGVSTCEARIVSEERDVQIDKGDEVVAMQ